MVSRESFRTLCAPSVEKKYDVASAIATLAERASLLELELDMETAGRGDCQFDAIRRCVRGINDSDSVPKVKSCADLRKRVSEWLSTQARFTYHGVSLSAGIDDWEVFVEDVKQSPTLECDGYWGNEITLVAAAHVLNVRIQVITVYDSDNWIFEIAPSNMPQGRSIVIAHVPSLHFYATKVSAKVPAASAKKSAAAGGPRAGLTRSGDTALQSTMLDFLSGRGPATRRQTSLVREFIQDMKSPGDEGDIAKYWFKALTTYWPADYVKKISRPQQQSGKFVKHDELFSFSYPELKDKKGQANMDMIWDFAVLFEYKTDKAFGSSTTDPCSRALLQALFYYHDISEADVDIAASIKVYVVATNSRLWWFPSVLVNEHMSKVKNWRPKGGPSKAYVENHEALQALKQDDGLRKFFENIYRIDDRVFTFESIREHILTCARGAVFKQPIDVTNAFLWFEKFREYVLNEQDSVDQLADSKESEQKLRIQLGAFAACIRKTLPEVCAINTKEIVFELDDRSHRRALPIPDRRRLENFMSNLQRVNTRVRDNIYENYAKILGDSASRHRRGDYYTPLTWVKACYDVMDTVIEENWRESFLVWDASCGTGNLTAQAEFRQLFQSTFFAEDISLLKDRSINRNALLQVHFDFLASRLSMPEKLCDYLASNPKVPVLFFNNPPFASGGVYKIDKGDDAKLKRKGVSATDVGASMGREKFGKSQQVHVQFLYKITALATERLGKRDVYNAIFVPTNTWCGPKNRKFLDYYCQRWELLRGFVFPASVFQGTKGTKFGISFTLWKLRKRPLCKLGDDQRSFTMELRSEPDVVAGETPVYFVEDESKLINGWCRDEKLSAHFKRGKAAGKAESKMCPPLSSGLKVATTAKARLDKLPPNAIGYMLCNSNAVNTNAMQVSLFTSALAQANGFPVLKVQSDGLNVSPQRQFDHLLRAAASFFVRRSLSSSWKNFHVEQMAPTVCSGERDAFVTWSVNCAVFCLFESKSQQSSMRGLHYKGTTFDVQNEFFFLSSQTMRELANEFSYSDMLDDIDRTGGTERFMFRLVEHYRQRLLPEAGDLLKEAKSLVKSSFSSRPTSDTSLYLKCWDAGWYQVKNLLSPDEKTTFKQLRHKLGAKLWDGIFDYKFVPRYMDVFPNMYAKVVAAATSDDEAAADDDDNEQVDEHDESEHDSARDEADDDDVAVTPKKAKT
jgi:hypothetical protein